MDAQDPQLPAELSIHTLLARIKDGSLDPAALPKDARQAAVEMLLGEGHAVPAIAQLLQRSDRTIKRDIQEIVERNALSPDPDLARQIVGEMVWRARLHHAHLVRLARAKEATPSEKAQSEFMAWRVQKELVERLQSLGYLPSRGVDAGMPAGGAVPDMSLEEAKESLKHVEQICRESGAMDPDRRRRIEAIRHRIELAEIGRDVAALEKDGMSTKESNEEPHE